MAEAFVTNDEIWQRLCELSPQLRSHISTHVQVYRGENWYLLLDELSGEHLRLNARAYALVGRLDGKRTLNTIYDHLVAEEFPDLLTSELVDVVGRLQRIGAISNVLDKSTLELAKQFRDKRRSVKIQKLISPLMVRIPLINPDKWLDKILPFVKPLISVSGFLLWLMIVFPAFVLALQNWDSLANEYSTEILKPTNILLLWLIYPVMKLVHEFAHALFVKRWGGHVHEMGITLLVLTPIPYVDASAASVFRSKYKRMGVSAAGILVELFMASIALFVWLNSSDGILRDCAFGVFTIGAVSTLLFNANPLLKFDGYFILQDLIEIPNLLARSSQYYRYLFSRYILKIETIVSPITAEGERRWFIAYGLASNLYRLFILAFIVVFLSSRYFLIGLALGVWAVIQQIVLPGIKGLRFILQSPETEHRRTQSIKLVLGTFALAVVVLALVPLPSSTRAQGVVWVPQQGEIFAQTSGFVSEVLVESGELVSKGQTLLNLEAPELEKSIVVMENELITLEIKSEMVRTVDQAEYANLVVDIEVLESNLAKKHQERERLKIVAKTDGTFTPSQLSKLSGRYFSQGDLIGHVIDPSDLVVRVAVPDVKSGRLRAGVTSASVTLAEALGNKVQASVVNEVPAADFQLPSAALGAAGGGGIAIASSDESGLTTVESIFHLQLGLPSNTEIFGVGERAYVTLRHEAEPLGKRWLRSLRQVFLKTLPA